MCLSLYLKVLYFFQLGIEGGFDVTGKKYEFEEHNNVVLLPDFNVIPLPCIDLPDTVSFFRHITIF